VSARIWIGTCGFSYRDWVGRYYPPSVGGRLFEYYSTEFRCVEIDSSYYGWLSAQTCESLVEKAPADFRFCVKLNRALTHERSDPEDAIRKSLDQNAPFRRAGKLAMQLAQFPESFRYCDENIEYLSRICAELQPLCVEFRSGDWMRDELIRFLKDTGTTLCVVDEPKLKGLAGWHPIAVSQTAYFRFHGRNAAKWHEHEEAWERYDYLYTEHELQQFVPDVMKIAEAAQDVFLFFNNHYGAQAVTNARQLAELLGVPTKRQQSSLFGD